MRRTDKKLSRTGRLRASCAHCALSQIKSFKILKTGRMRFWKLELPGETEGCATRATRATPSGALFSAKWLAAGDAAAHGAVSAGTLHLLPLDRVHEDLGASSQALPSGPGGPGLSVDAMIRSSRCLFLSTFSISFYSIFSITHGQRDVFFLLFCA